MTERINVQQVAWLVESEPDGLWWDGRFVSRGIDPRFFTRDPNEAIRFARREDAEKVASSSSALKATEHIWLASQPQQAPLKERPDFVAGYDAGLADGRRIAEREQAAQPVAPSDCARSAVADGFSEVGISHVLTGRQKTHGGCVWRLAATKTTPEA